MTSVRDDVHLAQTIASLTQSLYGFFTTFRIHPVVVAVCCRQLVFCSTAYI